MASSTSGPSGGSQVPGGAGFHSGQTTNKHVLNTTSSAGKWRSTVNSSPSNFSVGAMAPNWGVFSAHDCEPYLENLKTGERIEMPSVQKLNIDIHGQGSASCSITLERTMNTEEPLDFRIPRGFVFVVKLPRSKNPNMPHLETTRCIRLLKAKVASKHISIDHGETPYVKETLVLRGMISFQEIHPVESWMQKRYPRYLKWLS